MNGADVERARAALGAIDSSIPRADWLAVAMAAKSAGLELDDFTAWSSTAANFGGERDCASTWRSIKPVGGVTAASLFHRAREAGWRDDAEHRPRPNRPRAGPRFGSSKAKFDWRELWESAEPATVDHPYILRKLGLADGLRVYHGPARIAGRPIDGALLVPGLDAAGGLQTWQAILPDGAKLTAPGTRIAGGRFAVGVEPTDGEALYICEGVGAAWSAHQATRATAVACFGSANVASVAESLHEAHPTARIVIVADRSKESDSERIARSVGGRWVGLPHEWAANSDPNDVHARDGLQAVAELLAGARKPAGAFPVLEAADLLGMPPVRTVIPGVLPESGLAALYGAPGCGKSFLALDAAAAIAAGRDWFGRRTLPRPVTIVALEGAAGLAQRVRAYAARHGAPPAALRFVARGFSLHDEMAVRELADSIRTAGGTDGVVFIDTLNRALAGADENDSRDMGRALAGAALLRDLLGGLVVLIHHSGKDATRGLRGHSSLLAALDAAIEVSRDGDARSWLVSKAKDGADGAAQAFRLDVVDLGIDADGAPVSSCVVEPAESMTPKQGARLSDISQIALRALKDLCADTPDRTEPTSVHPAGLPRVLVADWRERFRRERGVDASDARALDTSRQAFQRAVDALKRAHLVGVFGARAWLC